MDTSSRFSLVSTFDVLVPEGFTLDTVALPGRKFTVKIFEVKKQTLWIACIEFLRSQKAVFIGAQGADLICKQGGDHIPIEREILSFDNKHLLIDAREDLFVASVARYDLGDKVSDPRSCPIKFPAPVFGIRESGIWCSACFCDI
ncbi:MAG TPA: hypothetical protein VMR73_01870 [Candidatus Paceibacterota bacterium]|nr:hypothetical protein [Candidatus Paceibacterota bacterium]